MVQRDLDAPVEIRGNQMAAPGKQPASYEAWGCRALLSTDLLE